MDWMRLLVTVLVDIQEMIVAKVSTILNYNSWQFTEWQNINILSFADIDDCKDNPCNNGGNCIDGVASYTCVCPVGFLGLDCEKSGLKCFTSKLYQSSFRIDWNSTKNFMIKLKLHKAFKLIWIASADIDDCQSNPCKNGGVCNDGTNSFTCSCPHGFIGDDCGISRL